ncbi:MAG: putative pilus assembly protein CpaA [Rhodospirillales bacterium]|nr:putative pilus assembly protein CpaA [Rhodospirillales bacterium]
MFPNPMFDQFLLLCFFALIAFAALSDIKSFRIPNRVSLALLALYPLHVMFSPVPVGWFMALSVASLVFMSGFTLFLCGMVGGGDVKLLAAVSLWAGSALVLPLLVIMGLTGGALAAGALLVQYARRYHASGIAGVIVPDASIAAPKLPYGVAIAAGGVYAGIQLLAA